ncbi:hypothetical protein MTO96_010582 [Rhipicephalus appendiculatus]
MQAMRDYTEASKRPDKRTKKRKVEQAEATAKPRPKPKLQKRTPTKDEAGNPSTSAGQGASGAADSSTTKAASGVKKVSRGAADTGKQPERKVRPIKKLRREDSGSGGAASSDKVVKRRRVAHRPQNASSSAETADVADDVCSAPDCVQPQGEAVNWVQCDGGCEQWFHLLCVGLSMNEVKDSEDYYCPQCSQPDVKSTSRSGQQDVSGNGELPELPDEMVDSASPAAAEAEDSNGAAVSSISEPPTGAALVTAAV